MRGGGRGGGDMNRRGGVKNQMAPPTHFLPDHMKALFAARAPLPYLPPPTRLREPAAPAGGGLVDGLSAWTWALEQGPPPPRHHDETPWQASDRRRAERAAKHIEEQAAARAAWQPLKNVNAPGDPYRTLFVGRLAYETTERKLKREFEEFGAVASVTIVRESAPVGEATGSDGPRLSRGYGFVEFVSEDSLKLAYRRGDGRRIDGRCVVVDVERGRTVPNWLPRRLGGGLGDSRRAAPPRRGKKDGWRRPGVPKAAGILTLDVKRKLAAAQQAAIDASSADASGGAGRLAYDARGGAAAARGGYSAAFDVAVDQLEREAHAASVAAAAAHAPPEPPQMAVDEGAAPSSATAAVPSPAAAEAAP